MKRYTLRGLIHDAKIFNQLRLEYRRTKKDRRKKVSSDCGQTKKGVLPFSGGEVGIASSGGGKLLALSVKAHSRRGVAGSEVRPVA